MPTVLELQEQKGKLVHEAQSIMDKANTEKRALTTEEDTKVDTIFKDVETLNKNLKRQLTLEEESRSLAEKDFEENGGKETDKEKLEKRYEAAFSNYLRRGLSGLSVEDKEVMQKRAQSTTGSEGGYTIPRGFSGELEKQMKYYGPMLLVGRAFNTSIGNTIDWPTINDTSNTGALIGENSDHADSVTDMVFGTKALGAYTFSSKVFRVSNELLQDSAFSLSGLIAELAGERLGRILNQYLTTGTGSSQPQGVVTGAANSSVTAAAAITFDNIIDLLHSIDPAYRPGAALMFNDATLAVLRKLKDGQSNYLWQMGDVKVGQPDTILGKPYYINNNMASIGASAKSVLCGDFSKYIVRQSQGFITRRLDERYADYNQTGFVVLGRFDGLVLQSAAIKYLAHAAS